MVLIIFRLDSSKFIALKYTLDSYIIYLMIVEHKPVSQTSRLAFQFRNYLSYCYPGYTETCSSTHSRTHQHQHPPLCHRIFHVLSFLTSSLLHAPALLGGVLVVVLSDLLVSVGTGCRRSVHCWHTPDNHACTVISL